MFQPKTRQITLDVSEAISEGIEDMTSLALFHGMRDFADMLLGGRARPEHSRSGVPDRPPSQDERHGMIEEMLLVNPAICASEFGVQWMYTRYGRD